jgi:hypothetical protein
MLRGDVSLSGPTGSSATTCHTPAEAPKKRALTIRARSRYYLTMFPLQPLVENAVKQSGSVVTLPAERVS